MCTKYMFLHLRTVKKGQIPAAFWPLFKIITFEITRYESFVAFIVGKPQLKKCLDMAMDTIYHSTISMVPAKVVKSDK